MNDLLQLLALGVVFAGIGYVGGCCTASDTATDSERRRRQSCHPPYERLYNELSREHAKCDPTIAQLEAGRQADRRAHDVRVAELSQQLAHAMATPPPPDPRTLALQRAYALSDRVLERREEDEA